LAEVDPLGQAGLGDYARLVVSKPVTMAGIYVRHFLNGVDVRDGLVYKPDVKPGSRLWSAYCFALIFLGALAFFLRPIGFGELALAATLIFPVLAIIPGAMETRFCLPLFVLASASLAMRFDWTRLVGLGWARLVVLAVVFIAGLVGFLEITISSTSDMDFVSALFGRRDP